MSNNRFYRIALMGAVASLAVFPAVAQKAKDTLRVAVTTNIPLLSIYEFAQPDADFFYRELYDNLMLYNEETQKFDPRLAKSAKQVDATTIEFELRDDVTFHSGNKMTADDAVYTLKWTVDPNTKMFLQNRYTGVIKSAEKTGPYTFRLQTVAPTAIDMLRLRSFFVLDSKIHEPLSDKSEYGRKGVGTGPLQLTSFEPGQKLVMTPFKDFKLGKPNEIGRVEGYVIGDQQTQIAQMMTGGMDLIRDPSQDQMVEFSKRPGMATSVGGPNNIIYLNLDATNRSGEAKPLTDVRVRRAIAMAVDREALIKTFGVPGQDTKPLDAPCTSAMIACTFKIKSPSFNRDEAKRLLKEAGYENGFQMTITVRPNSRVWGEAISGELRKVGIEVAVNPQTDVVIRKDRPAGKLHAEITTMPILALPDSHLAYQINWAQKAEDYAQDELIVKLGEQGLSTRDAATREKVYSDMFDRVNDQVYMIPIAAMPAAYLHTSDVVFKQTPGFKFTPRVTDFHWK
jgi:peptide/nickel transport system substrate-binding protein